MRILLAELGLAARVEAVPLTPERPPAYLRIHPFGTMAGRLVHGERLVEEPERRPVTTARLAAVRVRPSYAAAVAGSPFAGTAGG